MIIMENKNSGCGANGCGYKLNEGVKCDVKNCMYHSGDKYCTAQCIAVGPHSAKTSADTICATFKQRTE